MQVIKDVKRGHSVEIPDYDFINHQRYSAQSVSFELYMFKLKRYSQLTCRFKLHYEMNTVNCLGD